MFPKNINFSERKLCFCYIICKIKLNFNTESKLIKSTGNVVDSLIASLWCIDTSSNFEESVLKDVNLGSDSDTTGALYGLENIPNSWIQKLASRHIIDDVIEKFYISLNVNLSKIINPC